MHRDALPASTWLDEHLETFVRPVLGEIPPPLEDPKNTYVQWFSPRTVTLLQAVWERVKVLAGGREILLPGRDVHLLEVLARIEGFPTIFRPDISGATCSYVKEKQAYKECYCVDTGYAGSVPRTLEIRNYGLMRFSSWTYYANPRSGGMTKAAESANAVVLKTRLNHQIFPYVRDHNNALPSYLEGMPKYWERGHLDGNNPIIAPQELAPPNSFRTCASIIRLIAKRMNPRVRVFIGATGPKVTFPPSWRSILHETQRLAFVAHPKVWPIPSHPSPFSLGPLQPQTLAASPTSSGMLPLPHVLVGSPGQDAPSGPGLPLEAPPDPNAPSPLILGGLLWLSSSDDDDSDYYDSDDVCDTLDDDYDDYDDCDEDFNED